jgi:hypothetical protein
MPNRTLIRGAAKNDELNRQRLPKVKKRSPLVTGTDGILSNSYPNSKVQRQACGPRGKIKASLIIWA